MACKICKRNSCTESFHSLEEQKKYEDLFGEYENKVDELKDRVKWLGKAFDILYNLLNDEQIEEAERKIRLI